MATVDHAAIEETWRNYWRANNTFATQNTSDGENLYVLDMFPYPSGDGLHVGHPVGYIATDIYSRFKRMQGFNVLHPMGWDAFGEPAENHAIKTGKNPAETTLENSATFKRQMDMMGLSYDWNREISTTDPDYYKWTQRFFLKIWDSWFDEEKQVARPISELSIPREVSDRGDVAVARYIDDQRLVYFKEVRVNWCPALGKTLTNSEVKNGVSEEGHRVERRSMRQVMMRITAYKDRLLEGLSDLDWPDKILNSQTERIGKTQGWEIDFLVEPTGHRITSFTTQPETLSDSPFIAVAPEIASEIILYSEDTKQAVLDYVDRSLNKSDLERQRNQDGSGVFTGLSIASPIDGRMIPIYVADYVMPNSGSGIHIGAPSVSQIDQTFAQNLAIRLSPESSTSSALLDIEAFGRPATTYSLTDWTFSRNRFWGEPIPLIHNVDGTISAVDYSELPLELPAQQDFHPAEDGAPPLTKNSNFIEVRDSNGELIGHRETTVMPQWAGSCWYPLRFIDPTNSDAAIDPELAAKWGPVDLYVGGAEHATSHLLYSRFWYQVLFDLGEIPFSEPFKTLRNQGMLLTESWKTESGFPVPNDEVVEINGSFVRQTDHTPVEQVMGKMSKSLRNVANPDDFIASYGADCFRLHLMSLGPLEGERNWEPGKHKGAQRLLSRLRRVFEEATKTKATESSSAVIENLNDLVDQLSKDYEDLAFHNATAKLNTFVNRLGESKLDAAQAGVLARLVAPMLPFLAEETWQQLGNTQSIALATWPERSKASAGLNDEITFAVIQGKKAIGELNFQPEPGEEASELAERVKTQIGVVFNIETKQYEIKIVERPNGAAAILIPKNPTSKPDSSHQTNRERSQINSR